MSKNVQKVYQCLSEAGEGMDIDRKEAWETCEVIEIF